MKQCSNCKKYYDSSFFYKDKRNNNGLYSDCKKCHSRFSRPYDPHKYRKPIIYSEIKERYKRWLKKKRKESPKFRIDNNTATELWSMAKLGYYTDKIPPRLEFTGNELKEHLEKLFTNKMNWDNYGKYWEIDHIKPKKEFSYNNEDDKEFKMCWSLNNLRPLEKERNRIKYPSPN